MRGVFYPEWVKRLAGTHTKSGTSKAEMVEALRDDIRRSMRERGCCRAVCIWCGSTEVHSTPLEVHASIAAFERGLARNDPAISNAQMYAWARAGLAGTQEWLSFYFKSPMTAPGLYPEHDLFIQLMKMKNTMRWMMGEELITHLGDEYYD
jgi:hypothetical protein